MAQSTNAIVTGIELIINMINPLTLTGAIVGTALPYFFSGMLIESVTSAARDMVREVRRQFQEDTRDSHWRSPPRLQNLCSDLIS